MKTGIELITEERQRQIEVEGYSMGYDSQHKASEFIEAVENFVKSKREEWEKMIPSFADDREFTDIVLNFYERGIRDGTQMILERMEALKEAVDAEIVEIEDNHYKDEE